MTTTALSPITIYSKPGECLSWNLELPAHRSDEWKEMDLATVRYNDGTHREVAFPKNIVAVDFFATLFLAGGSNKDRRVVGMDMDR